MSKVAKWFTALVVLAIFSGSMYYTYRYFHVGEVLYSQIPTPKSEDQQNGYFTYTYRFTVYNQAGEQLPRKVTLIEDSEKPMKKGQILELKVSNSFELLSYEPVALKDLPLAVRLKLE